MRLKCDSCNHQAFSHGVDGKCEVWYCDCPRYLGPVGKSINPYEK